MPHQIILALDLLTLKFNGCLTMLLFEIQSNSKLWFDEYKIMSDGRSWDEKIIKGTPHDKVVPSGPLCRVGLQISNVLTGEYFPFRE